MKTSWKDILKNMVALIQEYQNCMGSNNPGKTEIYENLIKNLYSELCNHEDKEEFYNYLYQEFGRETELYPLLLSILYKCTLDVRCLSKVLEYLSMGSINLFQSINIRHQVEHCIFTNSSAGQNYELRREIHKVQLAQLEKLLNRQYPFTPIEDRSEKIIVITNQFLSSAHAPTRNVMELCSALLDSGKDVLLIIAVEKPDNIYESWYHPGILDHLDIYNGNFVLDYFKHDIKGYQVMLSNNNIDLVGTLMDDIYNLKPRFIWYMGGTSLFADLFRNCTTVLSMPFTDGFSISDSPIMIEYMNSKSEDAQRMEAYLAEENQAMVHFEFEQIIRPSLLHHSRKEFNLPDDGFLVTIVGNRLSFEITKEFIQILNDILMIDPNIYLVFIGDINMLAEVDNKRAFFLGLQKDLIGVLSLMDLFVNPPRKGGGTGAYWSLFNSVPVVTLGFCDVANCVNADFICKDEEDIVRRVERHFKDRQYHEAMKRKSKDIINEIEKKNDLRKNIETMINNVKTLEIQNHRK